MKRALSSFFVILLLMSGVALFAQEEEPPEDTPVSPPADTVWDDYNLSVYNKGDKTFNITLGILIPLFFSGLPDGNSHNLSVGGTGTLSFNYFLTPHFFVGAELSGVFASTIGKSMLYMVPFGARVGYQFVFRRFEFPLSLMIGAAPQKHGNEGYFGFILKPGASAFWRFNPDWSFGLNTIWWFVPQWPKGGNDVYGNFLEVTLTARYHF